MAPPPVTGPNAEMLLFCANTVNSVKEFLKAALEPGISVGRIPLPHVYLMADGELNVPWSMAVGKDLKSVSLKGSLYDTHKDLFAVYLIEASIAYFRAKVELRNTTMPELVEAQRDELRSTRSAATQALITLGTMAFFRKIAGRGSYGHPRYLFVTPDAGEDSAHALNEILWQAHAAYTYLYSGTLEQRLRSAEQGGSDDGVLIQYHRSLALLVLTMNKGDIDAALGEMFTDSLAAVKRVGTAAPEEMHDRINKLFVIAPQKRR